jgi:hypothetical protein
MNQLPKLRDFIYSAKLSTYASGLKSNRYPNHLKEYLFAKNNYLYKDIYYGSDIDAGLEVIYESEIPIWSMSYRGGICEQGVDTKACFKFLIQSLSNAPRSFPVRGPSFFKDFNFQYINEHQGDILDFIGFEKIFLNGKLIYMKKYFGGVFNIDGSITSEMVCNSLSINL